MGVPLAEYDPPDLSLAEDEGMGSHAWAELGFAGSRGGAFKLFLGTEETGCACRTSFCRSVRTIRYGTQVELTQLEFGSRNLHQTPSSTTSFILRHRFRKTASIRFRWSMMPTSSFAFVGLAA